ncbi:MAG: hypothetical protein AAGD04_16340 [Pseudomonadota bacterium]
MNLTVFISVAAVVAVVITLCILTVGSCSLLGTMMAALFAKPDPAKTGPEVEYKYESDAAQTLRDEICGYPKAIKKAALFTIVLYLFPVFFALILAILTDLDPTISDWAIALGDRADWATQKKISGLLTLASLGAIAFFSVYIIHKVIGVNARFASVVYDS